MANEPLHEIQLNGKQLVFLFMSVTVVAVVIFLAGVMVGRGVRPAQAAIDSATADGFVDPNVNAPATGTAAPSADPTEAPTAPAETLSYRDRLEGSAAQENLQPREPRETPAAPVSPASKPAPAQPAPALTAALTEPAGSGFVVQVAATREQREATTIAQRLVSKGYPAFVTTTRSTPAMFRVRVGKYKDRREAETVAARLERQEQFKPWVTN